MNLDTFEKCFDKIISEYSNNAGNAVNYCNEETGEALCIMRQSSEETMGKIKSLLLQYLRELN